MPPMTQTTPVDPTIATAEIEDGAVTNAKLADMAVDTVKGRVTAGTGDPEDVATTGSGSVVRATSPTLVTPALGTPASGVMTNVTGLPTAGLVDDSVTNAKLANMAVDTVKGRVTAGTGDPEDVATTGTGSVVRATSPTLVTPALGTPASGVMTNVTGLPTAGLVDDAVTYAKIQNVSATDRVLGRATAGAGDVEEIVATAAGRALIDDADAAAQRTTLVLGTTDTPQFLRLGLNQAADASARMAATGQYFSTRFALTDGATIALDWNNGNVQSVTLAGNRTFTFANPKDGGRYLIILAQDATGSRTITWPTIKWTGGTAPTLTTTASKKDIIAIVYDGTDYLGSSSLNY
mgnify:CR=1 FL=1